MQTAVVGFCELSDGSLVAYGADGRVTCWDAEAGYALLGERHLLGAASASDSGERLLWCLARAAVSNSKLRASPGPGTRSDANYSIRCAIQLGCELCVYELCNCTSGLSSENQVNGGASELDGALLVATSSGRLLRGSMRDRFDELSPLGHRAPVSAIAPHPLEHSFASCAALESLVAKWSAITHRPIWRQTLQV